MYATDGKMQDATLGEEEENTIYTVWSKDISPDELRIQQYTLLQNSSYNNLYQYLLPHV